MLPVTTKQLLTTLAVTAAGALAVAGAHQPALVAYDGHAGLGASIYQRDQTDADFVVAASWRPRIAVADGTSNTLLT
jgi:hypothetical protein